MIINSILWSLPRFIHFCIIWKCQNAICCFCHMMCTSPCYCDIDYVSNSCDTQRQQRVGNRQREIRLWCETQWPIERMNEHPSSNYLLLLPLRHRQYPVLLRQKFLIFPFLPNDTTTTETDVNSKKTESMESNAFVVSYVAPLRQISFFSLFTYFKWDIANVRHFHLSAMFADGIYSYHIFCCCRVTLFPVPPYGMESNDLVFTRSIYRS